MDLNQEREKTNPKQERSQRQQFESVILWIMVVLVMILSTCALALSIYASVAKTDNDSKLKETKAGDLAALNSLKILFQALNDTVENQLPHELSEAVIGLSGALNQAIDTQQIQYQQLNATVATSLMNLFNQVIMYNNIMVDLTAGCVRTEATCVINHNNVGTPPSSALCETGPHDVDVPGFRNVNMFCSVDNSAGEVNPVTSTLNIFNGEVSCLCSLIALTAPTASPECRLTIERCPDTL